MKNITEYILEGKKHVDTASIGDFVKWYCFGEMPEGKEVKVIADVLLIMAGLIISEMIKTLRKRQQISLTKIGKKLLKLHQKKLLMIGKFHLNLMVKHMLLVEYHILGMI